MIRLVCFDLNGTLISNNTWYELNIALGVTPAEDKQLMDEYRAGRISYREGQKKLEALYKKHGKASKGAIISSLMHYSYANDTREILKYIHTKGYQTALLSNSVDILTAKIADDLNIPLFAANNEFIFDEHDFLSEINVKDDEMHFKRNQLRNWCSGLSVNPKDCTFVGDAGDDREPFIFTGHGITFEHSILTPVAWRTVASLSDIRHIL